MREYYWLRAGESTPTDSGRPKIISTHRKPQHSVPEPNESACCAAEASLLVSKHASKSYERNLVFAGGAPSKVRDRSVELYASAATAPVAAALLYASISASSSSAVGLPFFAGLP